MFDPETFITEVYVTVDDLVRELFPLRPTTPHAGRPWALARSEVLTLALVEQSALFPSERGFHRWLSTHGRALFPRLPDRSQLNRVIRRERAALVTLGRALARRLGVQAAAYEIIDTTAVPLRNCKRRGTGVLPELVEIGWSQRLGFYAGIKLLAAVSPDGVITGYLVGEASANDRELAEAFFGQRAEERQDWPEVGRPSSGRYLADTGFAGRDCQARWRHVAAAEVAAPPQPDSHDRWDKDTQSRHRRARQVVETVFDRLQRPMRLLADRIRTLDGLQARIAAKVALHNWIITNNRAHHRPDLAIATVISW
jgi:hypothetical protein